MKKIAFIIIGIIIILAGTFAACSSDKGDDTDTTSTTTVQTTTETTEAQTEPSTAEPTTRVKPTAPPVPEWCEEIVMKASELPMELRGVTFKKAIFHKGTEKTAEELMEYGDDPYMHNRLYVFVEGNSSDLEIVYRSQYPGNVKSTFFFENEEMVWRDDGIGTKSLNISVEEGKASVSGFSSDLSEITNQARMFQEFIEMDGTFVKSVTFLFV